MRKRRNRLGKVSGPRLRLRSLSRRQQRGAAIIREHATIATARRDLLIRRQRSLDVTAREFGISAFYRRVASHKWLPRRR